MHSPDTFTNRLLYTEKRGSADPNDPVLETTYYKYGVTSGNPTAIIHIPTVDPNSVGTAVGTYFRYNGAQQVRLLVQREWDVDETGAALNCGDAETTLVREYRYDGPRQRYLEREWQPKLVPAAWPQIVERGSEYAIMLDDVNDVELMTRADAQTAAAGMDATLVMPNDYYEWADTSGFGHFNTGNVTSMCWIGAHQDPNAPDYSEPDGGWYWDTGEPLEVWSNPLTHTAGNPPWVYWTDPGPGPGGGTGCSSGGCGGMACGGDAGCSEEGGVDGSDPDDVNHISIVWSRKWSDGIYANWEDLDVNTAAVAPVMIERPLFVKDEWHDYDGDTIYADWTVDHSQLDPNTGGPVSQEAPLRYYVGGFALRDAGSSWSYLHGDNLGTLKAISDPNGAIVYQQFYSAFGVQVGVANPTTRYGYVGAQGYQTDTVTGFIHLGARYYDPAIGRFLMRDPIGTNGGFNTYLYAAANPVIFTDAAGLIPYDGPTNPSVEDAQFWLDFWEPAADFVARTGARMDYTMAGAQGGSFVVRGVRPKFRRLKGQSFWTNHWEGVFGRGSSRALMFRSMGNVCLLYYTFWDLYFIGKEAIYAYYDIPPGVY